MWNKKMDIWVPQLSSAVFTPKHPIWTDVATQVGFAEFNNTADNRADIGGTIIGAPIVGQ